jgi:predicted glycoside hydrolase/deacetylase ChbG (UPF0249 family)
MIRLVVDAAEFGRSPTTDAEILRTHAEGIVTSTSVVGNSPRLAALPAELASAPRLGVGLALALVSGSPVAPAASVASLLEPTVEGGPPPGHFRGDPRRFALEWLRGRIRASEVEHELEAQLERARAAGLELDHLCTVGHLGFLPGIGSIVERLARRHRIDGIRTDVEPPTLTWVVDPRRGVELGVLSGLAWLTRRRLGMLRHGPRSWGYMEAGRLDEIRILETIGRMGAGAHELICNPSRHPSLLLASSPASSPSGSSIGQAAARPDLSALRTARVRTAVEQREIVLCRWRDLY